MFCVCAVFCIFYCCGSKKPVCLKHRFLSLEENSPLSTHLKALGLYTKKHGAQKYAERKAEKLIVWKTAF